MAIPAMKTGALLAALFAATLVAPTSVAAAPRMVYEPIRPTAQAQARTIVLNGHDLSIDDVIAVARHGARVRFTDEALAQGQANYELLEQGDVEGLSIYGVNRGAGAEREVQSARDERRAYFAARDTAGARNGALPEIHQEEVVRAFLVIQANHLPYNAGRTEYMQAVIALLNARVTPVMFSRGTVGEGDLMLTWNFHATLLGRGEAYFNGERMPAAQALQRAGLKPFLGEMGKATSNAYSTALAALLVADGRDALEWSDLTLGMDLLAMNSSLTPMAPPVQQRRPFPWLNWQAEKMLEMLRGSYLMEDDPQRILQDAESIRASYIRLGSAWQAWADLRDAVTLQINSGEQNPAVVVAAKPTDHWMLSTPWMMRYFVKGGPASKGRSGYILSNANWDPYPMANDVEAFNLAFANMAVTVANRIERFSDRGPTAFFTGIKPIDVLTREQYRLSPYLDEPFFTYLDVWKEFQTLTQSVPPDSSSSDFGVADLEAQSRLKAQRGRDALDLYMQLLGHDLLASTYWLDVRKAQGPTRSFAPAATAAWTEFRKVLPWQAEPDARGDTPFGVLAYDFVMANPARGFIRGGPVMPATLPLPVAR
jgi:histidine ammonia-lyase